MNNLVGTIAQSNPSYLVSGAFPAEKISVDLTPGQGTVARGTILYRDASGFYAPAAAAQIVATNYLVVLDEEVDTDAEATVAVDAAAYRSGHFYRGKVTLAAGAEVTRDHEVVLRAMGIVFDPLDDWAADDVTVANEATGD